MTTTVAMPAMPAAAPALRHHLRSPRRLGGAGPLDAADVCLAFEVALTDGSCK